MEIAVASGKGGTGKTTLATNLAEQIPVLLKIPDDRRIAEVYSRGELAIEAVPETQAAFEQLQARIEESLPGASDSDRGGGHDADV